jgi:hypothetical protein
MLTFLVAVLDACLPCDRLPLFPSFGLVGQKILLPHRMKSTYWWQEGFIHARAPNYRWGRWVCRPSDVHVRGKATRMSWRPF